MTKYFLLFFLFIFLKPSVNAQVYINPGVDTTDQNIKGAVEFYSKYMSEFKGRKLPDFTKYWNAEDCSRLKVPDRGVYGLGGDYPIYAMAASKTITYVKPNTDGTIVLKTIGAIVDSLKNMEVYYISKHFLKKEADNKYHFISLLEHDKTNWKSQKIRNVNYAFKKDYPFNKAKADSLITSIVALEKQWNLQPIEIEYILTNTYDEIQSIKGFDFTLGLGNADKPSGMADINDKIVYCAGHGENYFHEVVHVYLNPKHPKSPLNEGLAVFYGGSMGKPLNWHRERLKTYLNKHPEINLNKLEDFWQMDNYTNPNSTIQGILCHEVYKRKGIDGLKNLMRYESLNEIFEKEFKFELKNLNRDLRELIGG
ncbi:MAG: hypothetical protein EOO90_08645 [Pedobacter sp.]|nr:MAG: hypothetical protein EOO90_08645 [Pedobacter sp.]